MPGSLFRSGLLVHGWASPTSVESVSTLRRAGDPLGIAGCLSSPLQVLVWLPGPKGYTAGPFTGHFIRTPHSGFSFRVIVDEAARRAERLGGELQLL
jgi:hypothetical protein